MTGHLVDPWLDLIVLRNDSGEHLSLIRYSAHPTILGPENLQFSAEYPGYLLEAVEELMGGTALFLGGALGSMGPAAEPGVEPDRFATVCAYADELARELLPTRGGDPQSAYDRTREAVREGWKYSGTPRTFGVVDTRIKAPPLQLRLRRRLRISPLFLAMNGVRRSHRMTAIRIGPVILAGFPGDFSGELSAALREREAGRGVTVMSTSFSGAYLGYISPDAYYGEIRNEDGLEYETGLMSWTGPGQERFFVSVASAAAAELTR